MNKVVNLFPELAEGMLVLQNKLQALSILQYHVFYLSCVMR